MIFITPLKLKTISTERVMIRPALASDADRMHKALETSFKELKKWMPWAQTMASLKDTRIYLQEGERIWQKIPKEGVEQPLQIVDLDDNEYIGATGIKPVNLQVPSFEIGYWVNQKYAGQGYITETVNALTRYLFDVQGAKRVEINCEEANERSAQVVKRLGFELEGKLKNHRLTADGRKVAHSWIYACIDVQQLPPLNYSFEDSL